MILFRNSICVTLDFCKWQMHITYFVFFIILLLLFFYYFHNLENHFVLDKECKKPRVLVTGSSSNHYHLLILFIYNVLSFENDICLSVWNLGLSKQQLNNLFCYFAMLKKKKGCITFFYNLFNYSKYPPHVNINKNVGVYAWKPIIISLSYKKFKKPLLWLDAGCFVKGSLKNIYIEIKEHIFYTIGAGSSIKGFTHIKTLLYLNVTKNIWKKTMCAGGVVGLHYPSSGAINLLNKWVECSLNKECIAPKYSNRSNHRQDQSVFSILLYQQKSNFNCYSTKSYNFSTHFDRHYSNYKNYNYKKYIKKMEKCYKYYI